MSIIKKNRIEILHSQPAKSAKEEQPSDPISLQTDAIISEIIKINELEIEQERKKILEQAKITAQNLINKAQNEALSIAKVAQEKGYKAGYEKGYQEEKKELQIQLAEVAALKEKTQREYRDYLLFADSDIIEIIMTVARKFIKNKYASDKEEIYSLVKTTIEQCSNREQIVVRVSVKHYDYINEQRESLLSEISGAEVIRVVSDVGLEQGSCIVETLYGSLNSGIDARLNKIEQALLDVLANNITTYKGVKE